MTTLDLCRAVIFDMDGLLLDTECIAKEAFFKAAQKLELKIGDDIFNQLIGKTAAGAKEVVVGAFGQKFPYDELSEKMKEFEKAHVQEFGIPTKPGIWELLDLLDRFSIPRAVATSTKKSAALEKLQLTNLVDRFDWIVGGDEVPNGKPAPDLFLKAAEQLSQDPLNCLVLEDSEPGIRAAHSAGMIPIMIPDLMQPTNEILALTFRVVSSLAEVAKLIGPTFASRGF